MLQHQEDDGVRQVHPTKRSLSVIASRSNIIEQNIPEHVVAIPNITDIPERVTNTYKVLHATPRDKMTMM